MKRHGFTLTELLTVLGIIGVLAAIIVPVAVSARRRGQQTTCLSNVRQLGISLQLYASDYDGGYPAVISAVFEKEHAKPSGNAYWYNGLQPYTGGVMLACPARQVSDAQEKLIYTCGYGMNIYLNEFVEAVKGKQLTGINDATLSYASRIVTVMDVRPGVIGVRLPDAEAEPFGIYDFAMTAQIKAQTPGAVRHNGGANYAFADGHAKWLRPEAFTERCDGAKPCFLP